MPLGLPYKEEMAGPLQGGQVKTLVQLSLCHCPTLVGCGEVGLHDHP